MVTLSAFADEISPDIDEQAETLLAEGIAHLDFRGAYGLKAQQFGDDELKEIKRKLDSRGIHVAGVGSALGKIAIAGDLERHNADFARILEIAKRLEAPYIRLFSFHTPSERKPQAYRGAVLEQLGRWVQAAERADVTLLHENEQRIYGDNLERCVDLLQSLSSERFRAALDPGNFLRTGVKPATHAYPALRPYLRCVHVKDSRFEHTRYVNVPAGEGEGEWRQLLRLLKRDGFDGTLSIEPHLKPQSPGTFRQAAQAIKRLLEEEGLAWQ